MKRVQIWNDAELARRLSMGDASGLLKVRDLNPRPALRFSPDNATLYLIRRSWDGWHVESFALADIENQEQLDEVYRVVDSFH